MSNQLVLDLENKKCLKIICGASNRDVVSIEKLVAVFSAAGCNFFDISPCQDVVDAVIKGFNFSKSEDKKFICISVATDNDRHISKASVDKRNCCFCYSCVSICPQKAIDEKIFVDESKCVGCGKCVEVCPLHCFELKNNVQNLEKILDNLDLNLIDCIELHLNDIQDGLSKWRVLNSKFNKLLGISINRCDFSDKQIIEFLSKVLQQKEDYSVIIQADGTPISGGKDTYSSTLQSVSTAQVIRKEFNNQYLIFSGGTNFKTLNLAKMCDVDFNGVSIGSFARKYLSNYIENENLLKDEKLFNEAVSKAKEFIEQVFYF